MPGKELVVEACVRDMAPGSTLVLGPNRIATPAALDLAFARGIRVVHGSEAADAAKTAASGGDLWARMKRESGTYVVVVRDGRAVVSRLTESGPAPFGED